MMQRFLNVLFHLHEIFSQKKEKRSLKSFDIKGNIVSSFYAFTVVLENNIHMFKIESVYTSKIY